MSQEISSQKEERFEDKFFDAILGAQAIQTAFLGYKLGWYDALRRAGHEGLLPWELAKITSSSSRYAREWLEQQTVAGWIRCHNENEEDSTQRRFFLPEEHMNVLANPESEKYLVPLALFHGATGKALDQLVEAYKNDTGVSWDEIGNDAREAQAAQNGPFFKHSFPNLLESMLDPELVEKLKTEGGRVADVGGGYAISSIAIAEKFPLVTVDVIDVDEPSIEGAKKNIEAAGLSGRVNAICSDAATEFGNVDLVLALECIHDMGDPISVLGAMRKMAGTKGTVIVMDEPVGDKFSAEGGQMEQFAYGFSCLCCLADCKSFGPNSAETGAVMRPGILRMYAQQAGFADTVKLSVDTENFSFYKLMN